MSFWSSIKEDFEAAFKRLFNGSAASDVAKAQNVINLAGPVVTLVTSEIDPTAGAVVGNVIGEIKTDLATADGLLSNMHTSSDPTGLAVVSNSLKAVSSNLTNLLAAGHVKNTETQTKVTAIVQEIESVVGILTQGAAAPA